MLLVLVLIIFLTVYSFDFLITFCYDKLNMTPYTFCYDKLNMTPYYEWETKKDRQKGISTYWF